MRFVDEVKIKVKAGNGGHGCMSFRREKFIPKGGPDGGDGGRGASVYFEASTDVQTLIDFRYKSHYKAETGGHGEGSQCNGRSGEDIVLKVPVGTLIRSSDGLVEEDLCVLGQRALVVKGGKGGLGNIHFKNSIRQAPRIATSGEEGEETELYLELKLLSEVGLVGFPNAGKSTLLRSISGAQPKVASYPFTTLAPQLGVVKTDPPFTVADIPGILEGAHKGTGLGIRFLKHISRTASLLFLLSFDENQALQKSYRTLLLELEKFDPNLLKKQRFVCINKSDLLEDESIDDEQKYIWKSEWEALKAAIPTAQLISAKHQIGVEKIVSIMRDQIVHTPQAMVS